VRRDATQAEALTQLAKVLPVALVLDNDPSEENGYSVAAELCRDGQLRQVPTAASLDAVLLDVMAPGSMAQKPSIGSTPVQTPGILA